VILTKESIERIRSEIGESLDTTETKLSSSNELSSTISTFLEQEKNSLLEQLQASQSEARRLEVENARLLAKMENHELLVALKDEVMKAKDETIQSLRTSMVVLERANKQLETEKHLLEDKQKPAVSYAPVQDGGFWGRLKHVFRNA